MTFLLLSLVKVFISFEIDQAYLFEDHLSEKFCLQDYKRKYQYIVMKNII